MTDLHAAAKRCLDATEPAEKLRLTHATWEAFLAGELHLSLETVRNHVRGILRALGVHSRLEAVAVARREHLVAS